ncbi:translation initiation factor IF-2 [Gloeocapsopsis dulcis]|uniref:Translation initiation factor IF-2 n=1 Tax=Gloeocapsopsis dulcis AAB1 = 1H9 TaxID=1433147 RepID=A0A6N8FUV9_9CHRO|nr:translation initiation factor IF-2 [Gloeocapsopsis dulcis]MUL36372.1 translation initiation factor IF-2 [Gloeocapsopsis dulcis AAB1 = 1H9]WNN88132.1 translation initiation factor IF-2 [Gloeocapsopsis dulcis]
MNNGKVRIYDLSKELNLDNKDLLAICDQLNIAVKSHSSTISEIEAERIRALAEKYVAERSASRRESTTQAHHPNKTKPRPNLPPKQQILEIRKPKTPPRPNQNLAESQVTSTSSQSQEESPLAPRPFASPSTQPKPMTPPPRPVRAVSDGAKEAVSDNRDEHRTNQVEVQKKEPQKPQLVEPPARPAAPTTSQLNLPERPILKRDQTQNRNRPATVEARADSGGEKPARRFVQKPEQIAKGEPVPELQRPKVSRYNEPATTNRPKLAGAGSVEADEAATDQPAALLELEDPEKLLKRPTPPRPQKGGKKWQEEEIDEGQDSGSKAGKAGTKAKRMKPIIDLDDEEDIDDADLDIEAPIKVSLSIARPPKQKAARPGQAASAAVSAVSAIKSKKMAPPREQNRRREPEQKEERPEKIVITGTMTVQELAQALVTPDTEIVKILFLKGIAVNITQNLDIPTLTMVANELGVEVETAEPEAEARKVTEMLDVEDLENLQRRPPVVTIMGHVDHGKTTLLDSIRKTKVAQGEAGGITQHIGAYHVDVEHNGQMQQVVFLDTPGHEAFTAMRARGARVTDIAILVVAADDGVRPQTIEAISHAQAAEVPIIVAINKIDKEGAQPDRVKQELTQYGLTSEEWGGETIMVPVSAIKGENLDTLLEMILLVAEVEELSANPDRLAKGTVIEAHLDKAKGPVATLLVQNGTLKVGSVLVAGSAFGKVRAMVDDHGRRVDVASPSFAVEVLGLSDVPAAGDDFEIFSQEKEARVLAEARASKQRQSRLMQGRATLTSVSAQAQEGELKELNLILKADVQGSVEAIIGSLKQLPQNEVQIRLLLAAPGEVTETDIDLAAASNAVIIGFNTTLASGARQAADEAGVDVREYNIIYKLLEDIEGALEGLLEPELVEESLGQAEVRAVFPVGRGAVAGCYVLSGKLIRNCKVRVRRGSKVVYEGTLDSLKRMKEDVREVNAGYECGIGIDRFNDWAEGDILEAFQMVTKRRTLGGSRS